MTKLPHTLDVILDVLDALVVLMDRDGRIVRFNHACERRTGYSEDEVTGRAIWDMLIAEHDREQVQRVFMSLVVGNFPNHNKNTWVTKSGEERLIAWSNTVVADKNGAITTIIGTGIDITDDVQTRRKLVQERARLQTVVETSLDAIISIDQAGIIKEVNETTADMFGHTKAELIGHNVKILMPDAYAEAHDEHLHRYQKTGVRHIIGSTRQIMARRKDGTVFPAILVVGEVNLNGHKMFTGFIRDMTAVRDAEARSRALQDELNHAMRLSEMGEMVATITHELNQPLSAISNYIHACGKLLEGDVPDGPARARELLSLVMAQAKRADEVIKSIREFLTRGETHLQMEDLNGIISSAMQLAFFGIDDEQIALHVLLARDLPKVCVDRIQMQQVAVNLVRNALEAMKNADKRQLTIETRLSEDDLVEINITDTGPGIAPEIRDRLFQPFVTTKQQGMGLGLSICKSIVELHGGTLNAITNDRGETVFRIRLPVSTTMMAER